jgi:hypothetical protein
MQTKPLDTRLAGVKCDEERRMDEQLDVMLRACKAVQDLCQRADRLSRRMDAWEESKKDRAR